MNRQQIEAFTPLTQVVRRLFHKLGHGATVLHRDTEVSAGMRAVLESVIQGGPQTVPHMARIRPVSRQHIQGLVNALLDVGLVEYAANPAHKRSKLVTATAPGRKVFATMRSREGTALRQLTLDCTPEELTAASRVLRRLIDIFDGQEWQSIIGEVSDNTEG